MLDGEKPTIETYYDSRGNGGRGCWRARLQHNRAIHSAGGTRELAVIELLKTLASHGLPSDRDHYGVLNPYPDGI